MKLGFIISILRSNFKLLQFCSSFAILRKGKGGVGPMKNNILKKVPRRISKPYTSERREIPDDWAAELFHVIEHHSRGPKGPAKTIEESLKVDE